MPPPARRITILFSLCIILLSMLAVDAGESAVVPMSTDDAIAHAKKIVNDMNDAATGTVTSYQPGREKEPVTCGEIMAKSVVLANEEKTAIIADRDVIVRAATLLTEKIDQMEKELAMAKEEVTTLEQTLGMAMKDHEVDMENAKEDADHDMKEASNTLAGVVENHEVEMKAAKADHEKQLNQIMHDAASYSSDARAAILEEQEKSRIYMDALKNATASSADKMEKHFTEEMAKADDAHARKMAEVEQRIEDIQADAVRAISESQQNADDRVASVERKARMERLSHQEATQKYIAEVEIEAKHTVERMEMTVSDQEDEHKKQIAELTASHEDKMKTKGEQMDTRVQAMQDALDKAIKQGEDKLQETKNSVEKRIKTMKVEMNMALSQQDAKMKEAEGEMKRVVSAIQGEMSKALAKADDELSAEIEENTKLRGELQEMVDEANNKQRSLNGDIKLLRSDSFKLENEVSLWREMHDSQGYCNTTLIKNDIHRFVMDAYADAMLFIEEEVLPKMEKIVNAAQYKAIAFYDEHLAETVNQNLMPVYNQHILPAYDRHIPPVVDTVRGEVQKARSGAAKLARQSSSAALLALEEKEFDSMLPGWIIAPLAYSSKDGNWAVDKLSRGLLILTIILCRGLIWRMIGSLFSSVWFFCPLRLFVRGRRKSAENEKEGGTKKATMIVAKTDE